MQSQQLNAAEAFKLLKTLGVPCIAVEAVKADIQINNEKENIKDLIETIKPDFLFYRIYDALELIGIKDNFKTFGMSANAMVFDYFVKKNAEILDEYDEKNGTNYNLTIDISNSLLTREGKLEIGLFKDGKIFGFNITDIWFEKLGEYVEVVNNAAKSTTT